MTVIAVLNESSDVTDALARRMTKACHRQIERDVAKLWYLEPWPVRFYKSEASVPKDSLAIVILDNEIAADALGYHFETPAGLRYGRVFAKPILDGGTIHSSPLSVSTVLSHEVIESFIDPDINLWAEGVPGVMWAYEACDPVERDTYRIRVDGRLVFVSNFVLPSWFDRENPKGARLDYMRVTTKPFRPAKGGYAAYWDGGSDEKIRYGRNYSKKKAASKRHVAARTHRRTQGRVGM